MSIKEIRKRYSVPPYYCHISDGIIKAKYGLLYCDMGHVYIRFLDWARVPPRTDLRRRSAIRALGKGARGVVLLGDYGFTAEIAPTAIGTALKLIGAVKREKGEPRPAYHGHPLTPEDMQPWMTAPRPFDQELLAA